MQTVLRTLGLVIGLVYTLCVVWIAGGVLLVSAMRCDEGCMPAGQADSWRQDDGAWQWLVLTGAAGAVFVIGVAYFVSLVQGQPKRALIAWLLNPLVFLGASLWKKGDLSWAEPRQWFLLLLAVGLLGVGLVFAAGSMHREIRAPSRPGDAHA